MTRLAALGPLLAGCLLAGLVTAQPEAGPVPKGDGKIRVQVVQAAGGDKAKLDLVLYALPPDGSPGLTRGVTDADGRFVFADVSTDPRTAYLVGVRVGDVPHGERASFAAGQKELDVAIEVFQSDTDTRQARLGASSVRFDRGCNSLQVNESHEIANPTDRTLYVPASERAGATPLLVRELPAEAEPLSTALGMLPQGLERDGRKLRFWGPLYPGTQELEFSYGLPARDGVFSWGFPAGAPDVSFLAPRGGAELAVPGLSPDAVRRIEGEPYTALRGHDLTPGTRLDVTVAFGTEAAPPIKVSESRFWIELDDAMLQANEHHMIEVEGDAPLGPSAAPLLCMELPRGAEDLRFGSAILAMGLASDASGALALRGPIPAGESSLDLSYRLPHAGDDAIFERRFSLDVPLLEMFVSDTGVRPRTDRLHRLKPIRNADRNYLYLQGFGIGAGEQLRVVFERLPAPRSLPKLASLGFGLLAAGATFAFLLGPLRSDRPDETRAPSRSDELAAERESVYGVIRDLDEDFETGKLSPEDHANMRAEMRQRAVQLLQQERAAARSDAPIEEAEPAPEARAPQASQPARFCIECGDGLPKRARFCPQCGTRIEAGAA